ncbi:MAG TPA: BNR-4 repeat-containing protein, partial [Verrucomicrobiae bacterium]
MVTRQPFNLFWAQLLGLILWLGLGSPGIGAVIPYIADYNTLHLWHLDENAAPGIDMAPGGTNLTGFLNGANLGVGGATNLVIGFNNAASLGTLTSAGAVIFPAGSGNAGVPGTFVFAGTTGAFTYEAVLQVGFNPTAFVHNQPCQIMNCDANNTGTRVFQFRMLPAGFVGGGGDTNLVRLEFINGTTTVAVAPLPTNGIDAIVSNGWYHVAVTYNGNPNTASNLLFYWTLLDTNRAGASLIYSATMTGGLPGTSSATTTFSLGNSARNPSGNPATPDVANFLGRIDEVRISSVARATNEFVFQSVAIAAATGTQSPNVPENTLDGNLATRWSAQYDGQYITYDLGRSMLVSNLELAFYQTTAIRTNWFDVLLSNDNVAWRPALTNAAGTNASLASFNFAPWPARYVRVVGHLNSQNNFNSITETVLHNSPLTDTDGDGLPDVWELYYFGNLAANATHDPDADGQSNAFEYLHGTDPTVYNTSGDSDGDGLPDAWELSYFGSLAYGANDDPDRDGYSTLQEYLAGSNPLDANSVPGDINGNNLPDAWETNVFGGLVGSAYDDADGDGYNNLAEYVAGSSPTNVVAHPTWLAPRVAWLRDSVITTNACLMNVSGAYGRAINGISFQTRILLKFGGYQYTAWYDNVGANQTIWLARRSLTNSSVGSWEKFNTGSLFVNGKSSWDAHCVISLGISPVDGTLHMAWDMHGHTLRYRHSVPGLCTTNLAAWGNAGMLAAEQNWLVDASTPVSNVTYPMFLNPPSGALLFEYRIGSTSAGDHYLNTYQPGVGNWSAGLKFSAKEGTYTGMLATGSFG